MPPASQPASDEDAELPWLCAAAPGGYAWWYLDISAPGHALTVILFAGAVFSPEYARRVRRGEPASGLGHPAVNLALHRLSRDDRRVRRVAWVMNDHLPAALERSPAGVRLDRTSLETKEGILVLRLDEACTRFFGRPGARVRGEVRVRTRPLAGRTVRISTDEVREQHYWRPLVLGAHAEVEIEVGGQRIRFTGTAYHDSNFGNGRLERAFARWFWAHADDGDGERSVVLYQVTHAGGARNGLRLERVGQREELEHLPEMDPGAPARGFMLDRQGLHWMALPDRFSVGRTTARRRALLLDTPFYSRFFVELNPDVAEAGPALRGVGEYLDLQRFRTPWVQYLLRYRTRAAPDPGSIGA